MTLSPHDLASRAVQQRWRLIRQHTLIGWMLVAGQAVVFAQAGQADVQQPVDSAETSVQLQTFDAVWNQVREQYFDYSRIEQDWLSARETWRPQAAGASRAELRGLLNDMLEVVGESHFIVLPPTQITIPGNEDNAASGAVADEAQGSEPADQPTGLGVRLIDDALVIDRVAEINAEQIQPGWLLVAIGDQVLQPLIEETLDITEPAARKRATLYLEASANALIAYQSADEPVTLTLLDADYEERIVTPNTDPESLNIVQIGNLPGLAFQYRADTLGEPESCIGRITFTSWVPELMERFLENRDALFACRGLIIDLRGNLGGVLTTMMPLTSHLVDEVVLLGQLKREDGRIDFRAFPRTVADDGSRITPFDGPVAILIDSLSASTSEMFSAGVQSLGRARIFGSQSPGMALPAQMLPLPNGDRLMYAFADYIDGQGRRIEGIGVVPDQPINPTRAELLEGDDLPLEAAIKWIQASQ